MRRLVFSILLAAVCAAVASSRVYLDFERVRLRIVNAPVAAAAESLIVPLPDLSRLAGSRTAIVLRLRGAAEPTDLVVSLGGRRLTRLALPPHADVRFDVGAQVPAGSGHELTFAANRPGWQLAYLEMANVHGFSQGLVDLVILPHDRGRATHSHPAVFLAVLIALGVLLPRPSLDRRAHRWLYWSAAALVLLLFGAALLAEVFTRYRILLSLQTFLLGTAVLYAEPLTRLRRPAEPHVRRAMPHVARWTRRFGPLLPYVAVPALILWCVGQFHGPEVGFTSLIKFGEQFSPTAHPTLRQTAHAVEPGSGYDGQFYAQLIFDPLLRSDEIVTALDSPGYRARRILFPWVAVVLGLGHPWFALQAYALLNVGCWLLLAWLLLRWLPPGSARRTAAWCGCLLAEGMLASIRQSLVDGPSMLLLAAGVAAVEQNRRWLAATILGVSGLGRDTNVIGGLVLAPAGWHAGHVAAGPGQPPRPGSGRTGNPSAVGGRGTVAHGGLPEARYAPYEPDSTGTTPSGTRRVRAGVIAVQALVVCAPLLVWMAYLRLADFSPGETGYSNFAPPFVAFLEKWRVALGEIHASGWDSFARFSVLSLVALTTQLAVLLYILDPRSAWWRMGIAYAGLMLVVGEAVWYGYPGATARVVLPMTFAFNILLPRVRWFWPLFVLGNVNILVGLSAMRVPWIWEWI